MVAPSPPATYEIETPRLVIRTAISSDADALYHFHSNSANLPYDNIDPNISPDVMRTRIGKWKASAAQGKNAFLVIALRETGELIGTGGFNCFEPQPGGDECSDRPYLTDTGAMIDHSHWQKGYATEVLCASVEFAFNELGCQVIRIETGTENKPWRALMQAMGLGG